MNTELKVKIESKLLPFAEKPIRYTGGELNCIRKDLSKVALHGVFCFPDLYDIGMSHFGIQILYNIVNKNETWALSRAFMPWTDAEHIMRQEQIPLFTLEYMTSIREADWIGYTVQYELQYTNIVNMLDLGGIPIYQKDRSESDPIVIAGGPCVSNPEPIASFIDAFAIGDGEDVIITICEILETGKKCGWTRKQKLEKLSTLPGVYVPSEFESQRNGDFVVPNTSGTIQASKIAELKNSSYPDSPLVPLMEVVHHRLAIEVMRGCTRGCRFCSAGMNYRPVRERQSEEIYSTIKTGVENTGWREIGLLSLSTADYTCLTNLLDASANLKDNYHIQLSLPSTRIDALTEEQLSLLHSVSPISSITIAPEAGSDRLRKVINKDFTDESILATVDKLLKNNVQTLKLYFMIGLPTETQADIDAMIQLITVIAGKVRSVSGRRMVNVAISPFSPKANTPFQREMMEPVNLLIEKSKFIKQSLKHLKNVKVSYRNPDITFLETIMARGDRAVGELIYETWKKGAKFDGWDEHFNLARWTNTANEMNFNLSAYVNTISAEQILPWMHISIGVTQDFLNKEREKAYAGLVTVDCRTGQCTVCGACDNKAKTHFSVEQKNRQSHQSTLISKVSNEIKASYHYRVYFQKREQIRFLGHLDMVEIFHRALSIAQIPVSYSNGFNPHPKVSFGPPLPLGVAGYKEAFDIVTLSALTSSLTSINKWLPDGIEILHHNAIDSKTESLNASIKAAKYVFRPFGHLQLTALHEKLKEISDKESIILEYEKNGKFVSKDVRKGISSLTLNNDGDFVAELCFQNPVSCKPSELLRLLSKEYTIHDFMVKRVSCFTLNNGRFLEI
jgi:radical SAM family uncharacterized protein/radical SAM-linked protein